MGWNVKIHGVGIAYILNNELFLQVVTLFMMTGEIKHIGIVDDIEGNTVTVRVMQASACSGCQVKSLCRISESKEKLITVTDGNPSRLSVGQEVNIVGTVGQGMNAVLFAFGLPLVLLLVALGACKMAGLGDGVAALAALAAPVPYYLVLLLFRKGLGRKFRFRIVELE